MGEEGSFGPAKSCPAVSPAGSPEISTGFPQGLRAGFDLRGLLGVARFGVELGALGAELGRFCLHGGVDLGLGLVGGG